MININSNDYTYLDFLRKFTDCSNLDDWNIIKYNIFVEKFYNYIKNNKINKSKKINEKTIFINQIPQSRSQIVNICKKITTNRKYINKLIQRIDSI